MWTKHCIFYFQGSKQRCNPLRATETSEHGRNKTLIWFYWFGFMCFSYLSKVQTRRQIQCVKEFETYFLPQVDLSQSFTILNNLTQFYTILHNLSQTFTILHNLKQSYARQLIQFHEKIYFRQCVVFSTKPPNERDKKLGRFPVETCLKRFSLSLSF